MAGSNLDITVTFCSSLMIFPMKRREHTLKPSWETLSITQDLKIPLLILSFPLGVSRGSRSLANNFITGPLNCWWRWACNFPCSMKSSLNYLIPMSEPHDCRTDFVRNGSFKRGYDGKRVQRFLCKICKSSFSESTFKETCWQKKPFINATVFHLLCGGFSQRRAAFVLNVDRKTDRKSVV